MKQSTNSLAVQHMHRGTRTTATRQTKQSILNSMLRAFLFLTLMVMGANGAWAQLMPTTRYDLSTVGSNSFALVNLSEGKAIYGTGNQDLAYGFYSNAFANEEKCFEFKLEEVNGHYYLRSYLHDGTLYTAYGGSYLNSQPLGGSVSFILGLNGQNGQDGKDCALWDLESNGDGTYKMKNVGTGKYLNNAGAAVNDNGANWSLCSVGAGCTVEFSSNNDSWGTVTAKRLDTDADITSGTKVPYGTQVQLTAHPNSGYVFKNWSNSDPNLTRVWTVTASGHPSANFAEAPTSYSVTVNRAGLPAGCDAWFTIGSDATEYRELQWVPEGTQVTFTMNSDDPHYTPAGFRKTGTSWSSSGDPGWMGFSSTLVTTVRTHALGDSGEQWLSGNVSLNPEFNKFFFVQALAETGGTATVTDASGHNTSERYNNATGSLTFTATPNSGYTFDGWYDKYGEKIGTDPNWNVGSRGAANSVEDIVYTAKFIASSEGTADFTDRGKGSGVASWSDGTLTTNKTSDNWANIFVFSGDGQNVTKAADKFSGLTIDALGDNFRLLVYYEGGAVAIKTQDCTDTKTTYRYSWTDLGVPFDKISTITRVCVAGNQQQENSTTTFSDARLLAEFHTVHFNALPDGTSGKQGTSRFTVEGSVNGEGNLIDRYPTASVNNVMEGATVNFYGSVKDEYKNTHLVFWESDNAGAAFNNNFEFKMGAQDVNVTLKIVEGARMHAGFVDNSAQPEGNGICFMQGGWNRGADALVYTGTGLTVTATAVDGYDFLGWYSNADGAEEHKLTTDLTLTAETEAGEHNYYAFYRKQGQVTLTYALNGGTGTLPASVTVDAGETISPIASNSTDAIIKGDDRAKWWNTKPDGTGICYGYSDCGDSDAKTSIVMNDDVTLYPFWRTNPKYSASPVVVETGTTNFTYKYKVTGDGVPSITLEKNDGNGNWSVCAGNRDGDFIVTSDLRGGDQKLPGWEVEVTVTLDGIPATESSDLYRLKFGHHSGHKYQWNETIVGIYLGKPAGYHAINVSYDGQTKEREFIVYVPNGASGKVPVLFSLHGAGNDYDSGVANYNALANSEKFVVVYPRGNFHSIPPIGDNVRGWLSTGKYNEDVKFFEDVIDWLNSHYMIDSDRVYMTGFSNGGMMTYSTAFTSDKFAGFAAVSGYPLNQFHLQHYGNGEWQGSHPVPFMHIQGKDDSFVPYADIQPIIDNMIYRNGCNFVPATDKDIAAVGTNGDIPATSAAHKTVFTNPTDSKCQFVYYAVEGMGHTYECRIDDNENETAEWDDASQTIIWNFLKNKKRINMSDYNGRNRIEFLPQLESAPEYHGGHGWKRDVENNILWQYGDKPEESLDDSHHKNVYHTIQLGKGYHNVSFTSSSNAAVKATMYVNVIVEKLGKLGQDGCASSYTEINQTIIDRKYNIGEVSFNINQEESDICEYRLTLKWGNDDETQTGINNGKGIQISNVQIVNNTATDKGFIHGESTQSDFKGFFNYENRLIAQWNFDLCDGARFNETEIAKNSSTWDVTGPVNGQTTYTYKPSTNGEFIELTYGNTANTKIPISAGLKFKADAGQIKIVVTKDASNNVINTQLVLEDGVQMYVPYVRNSYRADDGSAKSAYDWKDTSVDNWPEENKPRDKEGNIKSGWQTYWNEFHPDRFNAYKDCFHHINRDIVYIVSEPNIWGAGVMTNRCHNNNEKELFNTGGQEDVKGSTTKKTWEKLNFLGDQGEDCIITFTSQIVIDRLGVNRNLVYSFYTENIAATTDGRYTKPVPGLRIIGSPRGAKVADVGDTYATYGNAIAMTYGGWAFNGGVYQSFVDSNGDSKTLYDSWGDLTVYHGEEQGEGNHNYNSSYYESIDVTKVPLATDGFPVYSAETTHARSETLNPSNTGETQTSGTYYFDKWHGNFLLHEDDGGTQDSTYQVNYNPWTLPSRGAYAKFEPTYPGVLNIHVLQEANKVYYIADEYGRLVKNNVFTKSGTGQTVKQNVAGHFYIDQKDNVKYSFDVYPGKTYYLFSKDAGMGVAGFNFEPYVYRKYNALSEAEKAGFSGEKAKSEYELARRDVGIKTATMTAGPTFDFLKDNNVVEYTNQTAEYHGGTQTNLDKNNGDQITKIVNDQPVADMVEYDAIPKTKVATFNSNEDDVPYYDNKAVHVTLMRSFKKNTWQTIVLPFSMNNLELQTVFGDDVKVVLLRDVQLLDKKNDGKTTAYFIYHMNQDILAGYPYLIYPSQDVDTVGVNVYLDPEKITANPITISGKGQNTVTYVKDNTPEDPTKRNYNGIGEYKFVANYTDNTEVPQWSYVMSKGKLTRVPEAGLKAPAFMGYLQYGGDAQGAARLRITSSFMGDDADNLNDSTVDIEELLLQSGIVGAKTDVYSINGQMIRKHTDNLQGLKKGLYIVNGKKYFVK